MVLSSKGAATLAHLRGSQLPVDPLTLDSKGAPLTQMLGGYSTLTLVLLTLCLLGFVGVMVSFYRGWRLRRRAEHQRRTGRYDQDPRLEPRRK